MKLWEAPEIYTLSRPTLWTEVLRQWCPMELELDWNSCPITLKESLADSLPEVAGRACYWSYGKGRKSNAEYLANIIDSGHGSVLEHPHWTFGLKGISRSLSHELVRHRHLSFSQLSQRYVTEDPEYVVPVGLDDEERNHFLATCERASETYRHLIATHRDNKAGRAVARSVLPNATATRIVVTGNGRSLRNMLALRGTAYAEAEFRRLAIQWTKLMKSLAPNMFADFEIRVDPEVGDVVYTPNPKV